MSTKTRSNGAQQSNATTVSTASEFPAGSTALTERHRLFASFFEQLYLEKEVYAHEDKIVLRWPRKLEAPADYNVRLQRTNGRIYAEAEGKEGDSGDRTLTQALSIPDGEYELMLMPSTNEYYIKGVRIERKIPLSIVRSDYRTEPYGRYIDRQIELLRHAADSAQDDGLFPEIAKMTLGMWQRLDPQQIVAAIGAVEGYEEGHLTRLIGLLGMISRYGEDEAFPEDIRQPLEDCVTALAYCDRDYADKTGRRLGDTDRLLLSACEMLAGQRYPDDSFPCSGQSGQWHRQRGEEAVTRWLQRAATDGFADTSGHGLAHMLIALSHLIDLADSEQVWNLAAVVMDKALVTLALDSFQGVYGASQPNSQFATARSGYESPLAGIARLLWGIGAWNWHLAGPVSLACCQGYEQPPLIAALASETNAAGMWATEQHAIDGKREEEISEGDNLIPRTLHKAMYKTPGYLLCSAQDFQPGQRSRGGQSWQATLGTEAIVFVNHPVAEAALGRGVDDWRSGLLPRVAQHYDLLIALYSLPEADPLGFTRAYFPTFAFDEHQVGIRNSWAFAARGEAYIALGCSRPLELEQDGASAYRALRANGREVAWLCQMGRKADYGSFANFRKRVLAARFACDRLSVSYRRLQGDSVTFDWDGALCVNGEAQPLQSANHYEGPHCVTDGWPASQMVVVHGEQAIQLDFASA